MTKFTWCWSSFNSHSALLLNSGAIIKLAGVSKIKQNHKVRCQSLKKFVTHQVFSLPHSFNASGKGFETHNLQEMFCEKKSQWGKERKYTWWVNLSMIHCPNNSLDSPQLKIEFWRNNQVIHQQDFSRSVKKTWFNWCTMKMCLSKQDHF